MENSFSSKKLHGLFTIVAYPPITAQPRVYSNPSIAQTEEKKAKTLTVSAAALPGGLDTTDKCINFAAEAN